MTGNYVAYYGELQRSIEDCLESGNFVVTEYPTRHVIRMKSLNNIRFWSMIWAVSRKGDYIVDQFTINGKRTKLPLPISSYIAKISAQYIVMRKIEGL